MNNYLYLTIHLHLCCTRQDLFFAVIFLEIHIFVLFSKVCGRHGQFRKSLTHRFKIIRAEILIVQYQDETLTEAVCVAARELRLISNARCPRLRI